VDHWRCRRRRRPPHRCRCRPRCPRRRHRRRPPPPPLVSLQTTASWVLIVHTSARTQVAVKSNTLAPHTSHDLTTCMTGQARPQVAHIFHALSTCGPRPAFEATRRSAQLITDKLGLHRQTADQHAPFYIAGGIAGWREPSGTGGMASASSAGACPFHQCHVAGAGGDLGVGHAVTWRARSSMLPVRRRPPRASGADDARKLCRCRSLLVS
jgi:hypothetical protein